MTEALCYNCGHIKFGALVPCRACEAPSTGHMELDIAFTDHFLSSKTLHAFGSFLEQIAAETAEAGVRFYAFMSFVSTHHPEILNANVPEEFAAEVEDVLSRLEIPEIDVEWVEGSRG